MPKEKVIQQKQEETLVTVSLWARSSTGGEHLSEKNGN